MLRTSPNCNASIERLVAPSPAAFRPPLSNSSSLPPLRVTLTHFTFSSYERVLCFPTSFPITGLARLGVKSRLCTSFWRALASFHSLMLPSTFPIEALFTCPPLPPWNLLSSLWNLSFPPHVPILISFFLA